MSQSSFGSVPYRCRFILVLALMLVSAPRDAIAGAFGNYAVIHTFQLPTGTQALDILADGRIIALVGSEALLETAPGSRSFAAHGTIVGGDIPSFGAAFIAVSPDGTKIAVGNNGGATFVDFKVGILDFNNLTGTWFTADHFLGKWIDNTQLMLAASDFTNGSSVTVLDTASPDPGNPLLKTIVENIGGASGGIGLDAAGNLFVGNGFASVDPNDTGTVMAFTQTAWTTALTSGTPLDFDTDGTFVIDILGATPLGFDNEGNLFTGGGSSPPETDAVAIVRAGAIAASLSGGGTIDENDATDVRRLDPIPTDDANFFRVSYNPISAELYVRDFGDSTVYVYRDITGIPTVSQWGLATMSLLMLTAGTIVLGRPKRMTTRVC